MKAVLWMTIVTCSALADGGTNAPATDVKPEPATVEFTLRPIGHVEKESGRTFVRVDERYQKGLLGLQDWSHIWVFYWFDRNDRPQQRAILQVHPRGNRENPLTGVFATRSPARPNLIALSLCRVISIEGSIIEIETNHAFDQTPVIDIKPYAQGLDRPKTKPTSPAWTNR